MKKEKYIAPEVLAMSVLTETMIATSIDNDGTGGEGPQTPIDGDPEGGIGSKDNLWEMGEDNLWD
ncbi:MAG: hypothetical protein ACI350_02630 [Prevotella sp.]